MKYEAYRNSTQDPSLMEMTEVAVGLLSRNPLGFYLFVEGECLFQRGVVFTSESRVTPPTCSLQGAALITVTTKA
jgi:hypothetical protein